MRPSSRWPTSSVAYTAPKTRQGAVLDQLAPARTSGALPGLDWPCGRPDPASATSSPTVARSLPDPAARCWISVCAGHYISQVFRCVQCARARGPDGSTLPRPSDPAGLAWRVVKVPKSWANGRMGTPETRQDSRHCLGWSRGDSNPGPPPCKGGALPAKLRPPLRSSPRPVTRVGAPGLEPGTSALSGPRSHHLSYAPIGSHTSTVARKLSPHAQDGARGSTIARDGRKTAAE